MRPQCFSPVGKRVAYTARKGNKLLVVVDAQPGPECFGFLCGPIFRLDGVLEWIALKADAIYRVTGEAKRSRQSKEQLATMATRVGGERNALETEVGMLRVGGAEIDNSEGGFFKDPSGNWILLLFCWSSSRQCHRTRRQ